MLRHLLPQAPEKEATLLIARLHTPPAGSTATWEFPAPPEAAAQARDAPSAPPTGRMRARRY
ncbi:hypothetical protein [Streptomyces cyslabdanicus]|uniref:hypothetical protein n=1 Tax=Streptomyces cyslabdanicus TaxID=1470456 RepID=UPI004043A4DE